MIDNIFMFYVPQVAETNPPQPMDAAGEGLLYDKNGVFIFPLECEES